MERQTKAHRFHPDYVERAELRDGTPVLFRLIRADDKALLVDGLGRMSPESRFRRFFSHRDHLSPSELVYLTELDHDHHFALGAGVPVDPSAHGLDAKVRGLGVARFVRLEEPEVAEAAVAVVDEAQGQGLGKMLFERLVMAASERGVRVFRFEVLAENDAMLGLLDKLFPGALRHIEDGILTLDCPLPEVDAHGDDATLSSALYAVFRHAAEGTLRVLRGLRPGGAPRVLKGDGGPPVAPRGHTALGELIGVTDDDVPGL